MKEEMVRVHLYLRKDLLEEIDETMGKRQRSRVIREAVDEGLKRDLRKASHE